MWPAPPGQDGTIELDNLRTGKLGQAAPVVDPGEYQPVMLVGGWIVYVGNNRVQAADAVTGKTVVLGNALAFAPSAAPGIARVFILHLAGPDTQATAVPSSAAFLLSVTAWSPDSSWLFYQGPGQHMWAYQVTTGQPRSSTTTCCQYAVMATIKSPRS